jgi:hypothetical protein
MELRMTAGQPKGEFRGRNLLVRRQDPQAEKGQKEKFMPCEKGKGNGCIEFSSNSFVELVYDLLVVG